MKVIIAGSRHYKHPADLALIYEAVKLSGFKISEVISGMARGADTQAVRFARQSGLPVKPFPAAWHDQGHAAGKIRNTAMANYADALIAVWDMQSTGTRDMIKKARSRGLPVFVYDASL